MDDQGVSFRIPILEAIVTRPNTEPVQGPLRAVGFPKSVQKTMTRIYEAEPGEWCSDNGDDDG